MALIHMLLQSLLCLTSFAFLATASSAAALAGRTSKGAIESETQIEARGNRKICPKVFILNAVC